jgi:hypothetical protein
MCQLILRKRWGEVLEKDGLPAFARGYGAAGVDRTDIGKENDEERRPANGANRRENSIKRKSFH